MFYHFSERIAILVFCQETVGYFNLRELKRAESGLRDPAASKLLPHLLNLAWNIQAGAKSWHPATLLKSLHGPHTARTPPTKLQEVFSQVSPDDLSELRAKAARE